jgi:hypothetical protein
MSDFFLGLVLLVGAGVTAVVFPVLFAKRYPQQPGWLALGIVIGLAAMFVWPATLWAALAMWLTGFVRPQPKAPSQQELAGQLRQAQAFARQAEVEQMHNSAAYWHSEVQRLSAQVRS